MGVEGNQLKFFEGYLYRRHQRVGINGHFSGYTVVEAGVLQGSYFSSIFNDLESGLKSHVKFYADDIMLYCIVHDAFLSAANLNHDLELIHKWASNQTGNSSPIFLQTHDTRGGGGVLPYID